VHARSVLLEDRLGHEGRGLAGLARHIAHYVLVDLHRVGHAQQRLEAQVDLGLARAADLVVVDLHGHAHALERERHAPAQVGQGVERRRREVAALRAVRIGQVGQRPLAVGREAGARVPVALRGVHLVEAAVRRLSVSDVVEDVELGLGAEVGRVGDARVAQVALGLAGDVARVARVPLARDGIAHIAHQRQSRLLVEGVDRRRGGVGHEQHVRLADLLEPADRGAVEPDALRQQVLLELARGDGEVLPGAGQVGELQVDQ
jgi:hypothetical protein